VISTLLCKKLWCFCPPTLRQTAFLLPPCPPPALFFSPLEGSECRTFCRGLLRFRIVRSSVVLFMIRGAGMFYRGTPSFPNSLFFRFAPDRLGSDDATLPAAAAFFFVCALKLLEDFPMFFPHLWRQALLLFFSLSDGMGRFVLWFLMWTGGFWRDFLRLETAPSKGLGFLFYAFIPLPPRPGSGSSAQTLSLPLLLVRCPFFFEGRNPTIARIFPRTKFTKLFLLYDLLFFQGLPGIYSRLRPAYVYFFPGFSPLFDPSGIASGMLSPHHQGSYLRCSVLEVLLFPFVFRRFFEGCVSTAVPQVAPHSLALSHGLWPPKGLCSFPS